MSDCTAAARKRDRGRLATALLLALCTVATSSTALAQEGSSAGYDVPTAVTPPRRPTEIVVGAYLIGLSRVSPPPEPFPSFDVEMFIDVSWQDERLSAPDGTPVRIFQEEEATEKLSEIWSPDLEIQNEMEQRQSENVELRLLADGTVEYEERFSATLHADLDLRRFPFDQQLFDLELQSFLWDRDEVLLVADRERTGFDADFRTPEWVVERVEALVGSSSEVRDDREFSTYNLRILAQRRAAHYLMRALAPLLFVLAVTWCAFWIPVEQRFRAGVLCLLTVLASHTVIASDLPRLHYPTLADLMLAVCYVYAAAITFVGVRVQQLHAADAKERAQRIDQRARWILPAGAAALFVLLFSFLWS